MDRRQREAQIEHIKKHFLTLGKEGFEHLLILRLLYANGSYFFQSFRTEQEGLAFEPYALMDVMIHQELSKLERFTLRWECSPKGRTQECISLEDWRGVGTGKPDEELNLFQPLQEIRFEASCTDSAYRAIFKTREEELAVWHYFRFKTHVSIEFGRLQTYCLTWNQIKGNKEVGETTTEVVEPFNGIGSAFNDS